MTGTAAVDVTATTSDMPEECLTGRLGEICERRMSHFPRAYAWPALVTAATVNVPRVVNDRIRTNLYGCLAGPVGTGKSSAIEQALEVLGMRRHPRVCRAKYGSAEGMIEAINDSVPPGTNCLVDLDELGHLLGKAAIDRASFPAVLNSMYYADEQTGGTKATKLN